MRGKHLIFPLIALSGTAGGMLLILIAELKLPGELMLLPLMLLPLACYIYLNSGVVSKTFSGTQKMLTLIAVLGVTLLIGYAYTGMAGLSETLIFALSVYGGYALTLLSLILVLKTVHTIVKERQKSFS